MAKRKSALVLKADDLGERLRPLLKDNGFRARNKTFNRLTADGLTEVVSLQMGRFDPPGTVHFPGLRENLYGKLTINLGVFVPEVAEYQGGGMPTAFIQEYHCCIRARLGELGPERRDLWWDLGPDAALAEEIAERLLRDGFPFFKRFAARDAILALWGEAAAAPHAYAPPRIICAIILAKRGCTDEARALLATQAKETKNPGHPAYVKNLAEKLGLGRL